MKGIVAAVAVLAVGTSVALVSAGGAQQPTGERTFKLVERGTAFKFIDNPPKQRRRNQPPSAGDMFVFRTRVYDESGARVGLVVAECTFVPGERELLSCFGNMRLKDGTLSLSAFAGNSRTTRIAVTGGTGAYEGARGSIVAVERSNADNAPSDDTVHLLG